MVDSDMPENEIVIVFFSLTQATLTTESVLMIGLVVA